MDKVHFSSEKHDWRTPKELFDRLNEEFGFEYDLAASDENHLCPSYYTKENSALNYLWFGSCFCNPP